MEVYSAQKKAHPAASLLACLGFFGAVGLLCASLIEQRRAPWREPPAKRVEVYPGYTLDLPDGWTRSQLSPDLYGLQPDTDQPAPRVWVAPYPPATTPDQIYRRVMGPAYRSERIKRFKTAWQPAQLVMLYPERSPGVPGRVAIPQAVVLVSIVDVGTLALRVPAPLGVREQALALLESIAGTLRIQS